VHLERLAAIERELVTRNMVAHPEQYRRDAETVSQSGAVIRGFAGHLFIADGGNLWERQLVGEVGLTEEALGLWSSAMSARRDKAAERGVRLLNVVIPEKQLVLDGFRWRTDCAPDLSRRPLLRILAASGDCPILYPIEALRLAEPWCELYWRGNSHWCASGCVIAAEAILHALLGKDPGLAARVRLERAAFRHDLVTHFPEDVAVEEVIRIREAGSRIFDTMTFAKTGHYGGSHYITRNLAAPVAESLIIFGDSNSCDMGLAAALSAIFTDVHFLWSKNLDWDYVAEMKARFVIWESAERFLITPPAEA
jgi:alginate O-acetyltransferase complex protein AlgJ